MAKASNIDALAELAASQWGIFTSAQALDLGVSRTQLSRMSNDGRIESVSYGTYRFTHGAEASRAGLKAAWMSLFPQRTAYDRLKEQPYDAVVVGRTAACLHGDTDFYESPYAFAIRGGKRTARTDVTLYPWEIDDADIEIIDDLPVTSVERTISDLVRSNDDPSLIKNFVSGVCSRGHIIDGERLAVLLSPLAAKNGFTKGDGAAFVADLLDGLPEQLQISRAADTLARAFKESCRLSDERGYFSKAVKEATAPLMRNFQMMGSAAKALPELWSNSNSFSSMDKTIAKLASSGMAIAQNDSRLLEKLDFSPLVPHITEPAAAMVEALQPLCENQADQTVRIAEKIVEQLYECAAPSIDALSSSLDFEIRRVTYDTLFSGAQNQNFYEEDADEVA